MRGAPAAAEAADATWRWGGSGALRADTAQGVSSRVEITVRVRVRVSTSASAAAEAGGGAEAAGAADRGSAAVTRRWLGWLGVVPSETHVGCFDAVICSPAGVHVVGTALKNARSAAVAYDLAASRVHGRREAMLNFAPLSSVPAPGNTVSSTLCGHDGEICATGVVFGDRVDPAPFPRGSRDLNSAEAQAVGAAGTSSFTEQMLLLQGDRILFAFQQGRQAGVVSKGRLWRNVMFEDGVAVKVNLNLALRCDTPQELPEGHWCLDHAFAVRGQAHCQRCGFGGTPCVQTLVNTGDDVAAPGKAKVEVAAPASRPLDGSGPQLLVPAACRRKLKRADGQLDAPCALRFAAPRRRDVDAMPIVPFVDAPKSQTPQKPCRQAPHRGALRDEPLAC